MEKFPFSIIEKLQNVIDAVKDICDHKMDPDRTTVTGYLMVQGFFRHLWKFDDAELRQIIEEANAIKNSGAVFFQDEPTDEKPTIVPLPEFLDTVGKPIEEDKPTEDDKPEEGNPTEAKPEEEKPAEKPMNPAAHRMMLDAARKEMQAPEEEKPEAPATGEDKPTDEVYQDEPIPAPPIPKIVPVLDEERAIDWVHNIPNDKYLIRKSGKVINRYNGKQVFPIQTGMGPSIRLVGNRRAERQNPTVQNILLRDLMQHAFPVIPKKEDVEPTESGRLHIEDVTRPFMGLSDPDAGVKFVVNMDEITDEFVFIDFVPGIQPDKYVINKHGIVINKYTNNRVISTNNKSGIAHVNINNSLHGRGEGYGHGMASFKRVSVAKLLICAFLCKEKITIDKIAGRRVSLIDPKKPCTLDNINLEEYEDVL